VITVQTAGSTATLVTAPAASPSPSSSPHAQQCPDVGEKAEIEGVITALSGGGEGGGAPSVASGSLTVFQQGAVKGDYVCEVSEATRIRHGSTTMTFDQLRIGSRVHVAGSGLGISDGMCHVKADEVNVQQP
jgi:hypothetical protein